LNKYTDRRTDLPNRTDDRDDDDDDDADCAHWKDGFDEVDDDDDDDDANDENADVAVLSTKCTPRGDDAGRDADARGTRGNDQYVGDRADGERLGRFGSHAGDR